MGKLIVIEGLDGSGKETQSNLLFQNLLQSHKSNVDIVHFPNYDSESSSLIKMYLRGDFGHAASDVNPYASSILYTVDRFASYKTRSWGNCYNSDTGIVVADRYTTSNMIHQGSKLFNPDNLDALASYIYWLKNLEYERVKIPKPDIVIYLNIQMSVMDENIRKRAEENHTSLDIHEKDFQYLMKTHEVARYIAEMENWQVVDVCGTQKKDNGYVYVMKSREEISSSIIEILKKNQII